MLLIELFESNSKYIRENDKQMRTKSRTIHTLGHKHTQNGLLTSNKLVAVLAISVIALSSYVASGVVFSGLVETAYAQVLTQPQKTDSTRPQTPELRTGDVLEYQVDPNDPTKGSTSVKRINRLMFADCATRSRDKGMWLLNEKGDTLQHVSSRGGHASWASDRVRAVCIDPRLSMKILDLSQPGKGIVIKTPEFLLPEMPAWSPKANVIAFASKDKLNVRQIFVVDANGEASGLKQLTHDSISSYMPSWNGDGTKIIFSRHQGDKGLYAIPATGGPVTPFYVSDTMFMTETIWSPDGRYLVGTNRTDGNIYRLDADGTNLLNLTKIGTTKAHFGNPRFMNSGATVIFAGRNPSGRSATMFTVSINGGELNEFRKPDGLEFNYCSPNW